MKRNVVIAIIFLLVSFAFSACAPVAPSGQTSEDPNIAENGASMEIPGYRDTSAPELFNDIGTTYRELKNEYPEGEFSEIAAAADFTVLSINALWRRTLAPGGKIIDTF